MNRNEQVLNGDSIVETARRIIRNVQVVNDRINNPGNITVVLLGATGSGKTSLLHVLAGTTLKAKISDTDPVSVAFGRCFLIPDNAAAVNRVGKVAGGGESVTTDVRTITIGDVIYCDGPGFYDTNGGFKEMCNQLSMNKILELGVKVLWVVSAYELAAKRGEAANGSLRYLLNLLPADRAGEGELKAESIGIVISQGVENGNAKIVLKLLQEKDHHWLIDYWLTHEENVFWFPAPREEGYYEPPRELVEKIDSFINNESELITGSMNLQPNTINSLLKQRNSFDVEEEVQWLIRNVEITDENLDFLQNLSESFNSLWESIVSNISNDSEDQKNIVARWKRRDSQNPQEKFNFTLRNFVNGLDNAEYFKILCEVEKDGFKPRFDRGIVWEELVEYLSKHSSTSEEDISRLQGAGNGWKQWLPKLVERNREITKKIEKVKKDQRGRRVTKTISTVFGTVGATLGYFMGMENSPGIIASAMTAGVAVGTTLGMYIGIVFNTIFDFAENQVRQYNNNLPE